MKQCRLSIYNQVIEVFEKGKYDECDNEQLLSEIMGCPDNIEPLMWYVNSQWLNHEDYTMPKSCEPLTTDQLIDVLRWQGLWV